MKPKKYFMLLLVCNIILLTFNWVAFCEEAQEETVTLDFKEAELSSVLRSFSYSYNLNLVVPEDIKGKVTVSLKDVSVEEVLEAILIPHGFTYTRKGNLIYVIPGLGLERMGLATVSIHLKYLTASETSVLLQKVISAKGDIRINEATNSLVMTDYPPNIEMVKEVLEDVDIPPIQILIEAKMVDIESKYLKNLGVTWYLDYAPGRGLFGRGTTHAEELKGTVTMAGPSESLTGGQIQFSPITFKGLTAEATLDALIQDNKANLLASPSIATLNGKEARIVIGERYPYKEKTQTTTGTTETTKFVDIGTSLRVTPQASPDGWITMMVHPEVSEYYAALDAGPRITTQEADATIRVFDGRTIAIGGLIKHKKNKIVSRVPILGYIPIVGLFFSKTSTDLTQRELVVFITPHIVRTPEQKALFGQTKQEVYVEPERLGARNLINWYWKWASNLEENKGIESLHKDKRARMLEALDLYRYIANHFPESEKAGHALYRAGSIAYRYFKDLKLARELYAKVVERYPESAYYNKAKRKIENIDRKLAKKLAAGERKKK